MAGKKSVEARLAAIERQLRDIKKAVVLETKEEKLVENQEERELAELKRLEAIENEIKKDVQTSPLRRITYRDFTKSMIGAFFGVMGHFSFFYGLKISEHISLTRATSLYVVAFIIGVIFLYFSGFRKVNTKHQAKTIVARLAIIYCTSIAMILVVLFLFDYVTLHSSFKEVYATVATISILAVMGASTADLIGREE